MAVRELGTNAIEWGHQKQVERIVTVTYRIDAEKITIVIQDTGPALIRQFASCRPLRGSHRPHDGAGSLGIREGALGSCWPGGWWTTAI